MRTPKYDKDLMPTTADTAVLMWDTREAFYVFAMKLSKIYDIAFVRDDDLVVNTGSRLVMCPCYSYGDSVRQLFYVLIENPIFSGGLGGQVNHYTTLLLINGQNAWDRQQEIYQDFTNTLNVPNDVDWYAREKYGHLSELRAQVVQTDYFDFRDELSPQSSVYAHFSQRVSNRIPKYFEDMEDCLKSVIWSLTDPENASDMGM